jgi:hypothetical protein
VALVALAVLAAPVPKAVAQAPARPEPQELWRQFPLDSAPSNSEAPAGRGSAPPVSPSTSRRTAEEGRDGSLSTVQIAAIVLTVAFLLMLTTAVLAYATRARFEFDLGALRNRFRGFSRSRAAPRALRARGPRYELRRIASNMRERILPADPQSTANEVAALEEALDAYLAGRAEERTADEELETLKAKLDVDSASASSPAEQELEILRAKRRKPGDTVDVERADEVETLKAKLAGNAVTTEGETATRNVLEATSTERGATPKKRPVSPGISR